MLYLLLNKKKQSPWQMGYESSYIEQLHAIKYPFVATQYRNLKLEKGDYLWVMHYEDLRKDFVKDTEATVISQVNGTSANPYVYQVKSSQEQYEMENIIDIALVFNQRVEDEFKKHFKKVYTIQTGFPIDIPNLKEKEKENKIVIGGRISPDKQFYLATYLLKDIVKKYKVVFCYGEGEEKWLEMYGVDKFEKMGFKFKECTRMEWLREANTAKYVFSCSLGDVMSVSVAEGIMLGCVPIVPRFDEGLPAYDSYINFGYAPFSKIAVESAIEYPPLNLAFNRTLFDPKVCLEKLLIGLKKYEESKKTTS